MRLYYQERIKEIESRLLDSIAEKSGLRDWEKKRDELLALTESDIKAIKGIKFLVVADPNEKDYLEQVRK